MRVLPMLQVADVEATSSWYQRVLGLVSGHGGDEYEMLFEGEPYASALLLQLHRWDAHEHAYLGSPDLPRGNGTALFFEVADRAALDAIWARARGETVLEAPHWNPLAHHWALALHDPDGYVVVVNTPHDPSAAP
jgi:catechol 2,3-dioxygenase-like lactoylglutathione lyase family enzyme